jgi:hypothetical protein
MFKINGKEVGRMIGLPNTTSDVTMHMAVCLFKAGDCIEVGGDHLDVMNPSKIRSFRSLKDVSVHGCVLEQLYLGTPIICCTPCLR